MALMTVLRAADGRLLCKRRRGDHWAPAETPFLFTVEQVALDSVRELGALLGRLGGDPAAAVIRGEPVAAFRGPVRRLRYDRPDAAATFRSVPGGPGWVCFDLDKVATPPQLDPALRPAEAAAWLRSRMPDEFADVACVAQWSASAGLDGWRTLSAHLWFLVDGEASDEALASWARDIDLCADARLFDPVQLHFTAAPLFLEGADPVGERVFILDGRPRAHSWAKGTYGQIVRQMPRDWLQTKSLRLHRRPGGLAEPAIPRLLTIATPTGSRRPITLLSRSPTRRRVDD